MRTPHNAITPCHLNENLNGARVVLYEKDILVDELQIIEFDKELDEISLKSLSTHPKKIQKFFHANDSWHFIFPDPFTGTTCINKKLPCQLFLSSTQ